MPGFVVHTLLALRVLDRWRESPSTAPWPVQDSALSDVFLAGSIGPDMGLYPGGNRLSSDLAHYGRSGQLARSLIREARSNTERAFAWGWLTHVLADVKIHPLINLAAGIARGCSPITYADDPQAHLMVEMGVDGGWYSHWRKAGLGRLPRLPDELIGFLVRAYSSVYGRAISGAEAAASSAAWSRWQGFTIALAGAASQRLYGRVPAFHGFQEINRRAVKVCVGLFARRSLLHALTHPAAPAEEAATIIERAIGEFPERFLELQRAGLESLPDYNLDTGIVEEPVTYGPTRKALERLGEKVRVKDD